MATQRRNALGRGLDALLSMDDVKTEGSSSINEIELAKISVNPNQPRREFDETALQELADSIAEIGIIQPITLRKVSDNEYQIIAGERRYRASQRAGLKTIPAYIRTADDENMMEMALIENIQREDLNPLEEAQGIHRLITDFNFTHEQAASAVGRSRSAVTNLLRLLNLTRPVQTMLVAGDIDMGHARALLSVDGAKQIALATQIVSKRMSVREAERLVSQELNDRSVVRKTVKEKSADLVQLEEELSDMLATKVSFKLNAKGSGQLVIDFSDLDVLDGLIRKIRQNP